MAAWRAGSAASARTLVNSFPHGAILLFDHDLRFVAAGGPSLDDLGVSRATLEGRTLFEVFPAEMTTLIEPSFRTALAGGEATIDTRHGDRVLEFHLAPVRESGVVVAGMGYLLRQASTAADTNRGRYLALVDYLTDTGAYVWDRAHRVSDASGAGIASRGFIAADLLGRRPEQFMTPTDAALVHGYLDAAFRGETIQNEVRFETTGILNLVNVLAVAPPPSTAGGGPDEVLLLARDIGDLRRREQALAAAEARWRVAFDGAPVGMAEMDIEGRILRSNQALNDIMRLPPEALLGRPLYDHFHPDELTDALAHTATIINGGPLRAANERRLPPDANGEQRWISNHATRLRGTDGAPDRMLVHVVDISARRQQQALLEATYARFSALVEHSADAITVIGPDGRVSYASPAFTALTGIQPVGGIGSDLATLIHPSDRANFVHCIDSLVAPGDVARLDCRIGHGSSGWHDVEVSLTNRLDDPAVNGIVANLRNVTERVEAAAHLAHQAMHDTLTQLPNRALLLERLTRALSRPASSRPPCALLFLDLDRFKEINDTLGHAAGDRVLTVVAQRLVGAVRPGDSVARLGGDEFVVVAENIRSRAVVADLAERIRGRLVEPIDVGGRRVTIGCSIGVAISGDHTPETLLQEADMALYRAKGTGRNRWELYDQAMRTQARQRFSIEMVLRAALDAEALVVHYQPIVDMRSGRFTSTEALVRIRDDDGRLISPEEFIGVAEETGLIVALGAAVLRESCFQQARWRDADIGMNHVAVNVSARQLTPGFAAHVAETLAAAGLPPAMLCIELTESVLIDAGTSAQEEILALKALGVTLALDDFGTGWSSLANLRRFPFDVVKIDRSFVSGLGTDNDDTEVVKAIIGLGRALGLQTVGEGIETEEQGRLLAALGCDYAQGYLYGRPEAPGDITWRS
jgi:diguanylate cyclase (GGDEF)-like protein/PAS domain S-box-containing protein